MTHRDRRPGLVVVGTDTGDLVCIVAGPCEWGEIPWPKYRRTVWNWGVVPMNK